MTVAGSDSGGGAGLQADLRVFSDLGVHGTSAISAITAQSTVEVAEVFPVPADFVSCQMETVLKDINVSAIKTGILLSAGVVEAVAETIKKYKIKNLVIDPVMQASTGREFLDRAGVVAMKEKLFPLAQVVTPNAHEAEALCGVKVTDIESMKIATVKIAALGPKNVIIKGGHVEGDKVADVLYTADGIEVFTKVRIKTSHTHGTGCVFSSAITAELAKGSNVLESFKLAEGYIERAIKQSGPIGKGSGPVGLL